MVKEIQENQAILIEKVHLYSTFSSWYTFPPTFSENKIWTLYSFYKVYPATIIFQKNDMILRGPYTLLYSQERFFWLKPKTEN